MVAYCILDRYTTNIPTDPHTVTTTDIKTNMRHIHTSIVSFWTCDACSAPQSQQSPPPNRSPAPPTKQISDDSTFNVLQLNVNGIWNKLTELEVVLEINKVKVVVIQESKLSPKSKNPCIQNYTTVRKDRSHGQGGGLLHPASQFLQ